MGDSPNWLKKTEQIFNRKEVNELVTEFYQKLYAEPRYLDDSQKLKQKQPMCKVGREAVPAILEEEKHLAKLKN